MIQANELRIGNKIFLFTKQEVFEVVSMTKRTISSDSYCREHSEFEGIPLTEEILLKCGFLTALRVKGLTRYGIDFFIIGNEIYENIHGVKVETVHQLQNLMFALTGKELEINL